jgi:hypothetical protein
MNSDDNTAMSAIERAHQAYEQMKRRQYNAVVEQRARDRSRNIKLAATAAVMIVFFLGLSIHNGWLTNSIRSSEQQSTSGRSDNRNFGETRTAPIRSFVKGNTCQEMQFNNDQGIYVRGALVPCEVESKREPLVLPLLPQPGSNPSTRPRLDAVRDAFTK